MSEIKAMYRTVMADHFPPEMTISFGDQKLLYRKRTWKLHDAKGEVIEMGLRYGENPGQEAALYELVGGNLTLGGCHFLDPGNGLISAIDEAAMLQAGKHPGKTNLTDLDNGLNIIKYLQARPAAVILKHNNPCGAAWAGSLAEAYDRANLADRIAAFGGAAVFNRPLDKTTVELISGNTWRWWLPRTSRPASWIFSKRPGTCGSSKFPISASCNTWCTPAPWNSRP